MPDDEAGGYIHGTHREERRRLTRLNELMNARALRDLALAPGDKVLDVGSGLGLLTREIAALVGPHGRVLGIERDQTQLAEALHSIGSGPDGHAVIEFRRGDATKPPLRPGEWGCFDVAHCRFVLEHVREPERVVEAMAQAVRPGGRVILEDDDHDLLRLWPPVPAVARLWQSYLHSYQRRGNDPFIGRRLVELLCEAGLEPQGCAMPRFGSCAGGADFEVYVDNMKGLFEGARDDIQREGAVSDAEFRHGLSALEAWGCRPDATLWYVTCWAEGQRPEPGEAA
jgi:ubiquinone/menaquinone biosynthesis C-methylase UbiE